MSRRDIERRRDELLAVIQQQRLDLQACQRDWCQATRRYDQLWVRLTGLRRYIAIGGGLATLWSLRHPGFVARWAKRGFGLWSSWRMIRNNLPGK
ncbi:MULTISPECIES: YqjK-like family protein [Tatumella]|uniref:YqjK-like family protein n=1 Tax=Tatumella punctata TaxID=399969 RepID=A0ABW1VLL8_9GAMM|nr:MULTISPECIES: YqjK-like family protein [unclassified Tatumella]MBS0855216.1 YqjK-like family protein [Tatumella sp. JGM16]MBS0876768.1 YqjK-like family protein [Tatumella sp. JGM82]MBS0889807.1 YqjK-like family protein [Tatumella sp. JGM94]MBS0892885.1 YqjK-like family protein [Tatumella sp. JGM130]MBS0901523.1 YqjK-like family protein [Tatumella sp. JGM100]